MAVQLRPSPPDVDGSSIGRASDCDSGGCEFDSRPSTQVEKNMNPDYKRDGYIFIKNFISKEISDMLCAYVLKLVSEGKAIEGKHDGAAGEHPLTWNIGKVSGWSFGLTPEVFDILLSIFTPRVSKILDLDIVPTYYYQRTYLRGSSMNHHIDRSSCEISCTMNLGQSHKWPINIVNKNIDKPTSFQTEPGDVLLYNGCTQEHWRDKFEGDWYCQLFFHWVTRNKRNEQYYWQATGGVPPSEVKKAYVSDWKRILHQQGIMNRQDEASNYHMNEMTTKARTFMKENEK